jgi:hypothetical protein
MLVIDGQTLDDLLQLSNRLRRLALFEDRIRAMVTARQ